MRSYDPDRSRLSPPLFALGAWALLLVVLAAAFARDFGLPFYLRWASDRPGLRFEVRLDPSSGRLVDGLGRSYAVPFDLPVDPAPPASLSVEVRLRVAAEQRPYATILSNHCCDHAGFTVHRLPGPGSTFAAGIGTGQAWREVARFDLEPGKEAVLVVQVADGRLGLRLDGRPVPVAEAEPIRPSPIGLTLGDWVGSDRGLAGAVLSVAVYDRPLPSP